MKNLIIVCDERRREFADYLSQLISMEDDADNNTIGVKDGTVATQVWGEKEYKANSATISSNQHILFIGNSKLIKDKRSHMKSLFSKFGINYGWLGKQGAIAVEKTVSLGEYEEFINFGKKYEERIVDLVKKRHSIKGLVATIFFPWPETIKMESQIKKQMYSCAVMKFYLEDLNRFLGLEQAE